MGFEPLDQVVKVAPAVVVGRVVAIGAPRAQFPDDDPTYVEVEVLRTVKGSALDGRIEVWNNMAGTSCGGALKGMTEGARSVLAIRREDDSASSVDSLWIAASSGAMTAVTPSPTDFVLRHPACAESLKLLTTPEDTAEWMAKTVQ